MAEKVWMGAIYLKDEGGYKIILRALNHYKKRLKTIGKSPELQDAAAMFASVLHSQAVKVVPQIDTTIKKIEDSLPDIQMVSKLNEDVPFLAKSLSCYEADIHKAEDTGHEYFVNLVGNIEEAKKDLEIIRIAQEKINQYSEQ